MKNLFVLLLALCLLLSCFLTSCGSCDETPDGGDGDGTNIEGDGGSGGDKFTPTLATYNYELTADGTGYIVTGINITSPQKITVPSRYEGKPVVAIADNAFWACSAITGVTVPDSVKSIGANAFSRCDKIESVKLGFGVESIGEYAFFGLASVKTVAVHDANPIFKAENGCLINKSTGALILSTPTCAVPNDGSVTSIASGAFAYLPAAALTIPKSVTSIAADAFYAITYVNGFYYDGTTAEWEAIAKADGWIKELTFSFTIICSDGGVDITPAEAAE